MAKRRSLIGIGAGLLDNDDENARHPVDAMTGTGNDGKLINLPVDVLDSNPDQPRTHFDAENLEGLAQSMKADGIITPITVRPADNSDRYMVVAGERRLRAAKLAGLRIIPAIVRTNVDPAELAMIENVQRQNLTAIEEAEGLSRLKTMRGYTAGRLSEIIGKSVRSVEESISLTSLPELIRDEARTSAEVKKSQLLQVLRAPNYEAQQQLWERIKNGDFTVRDAKKTNSRPPGKPGPKPFTHTFKPKDKTYTVTVKFRKSAADPEEIRKALEEAIDNLT
jgi:ParB family chromosome partitioning protein